MGFCFEGVLMERMEKKEKVGMGIWIPKTNMEVSKKERGENSHLHFEGTLNFETRWKHSNLQDKQLKHFNEKGGFQKQSKEEQRRLLGKGRRRLKSFLRKLKG